MLWRDCAFAFMNLEITTKIIFCSFIACDLPILARPPDLENHGKARYALMMIGNFGQGERGRGNMSAVWDGSTGINIPYFGSQAPWNFYLKVNRP